MESTGAAFQVVTGAGVVSVRAEDVYFAFPSGGLGYDCIACGAECCKGHGYLASSEHELLYQLTRRPQIAVFVTRTGTSSSQRLVSNCPPGCFFLSEAGRCQVQDEFGYDAKPETCRLFPFNQFRMVGKYLVVSPHAYLCPLSATPPGTHSVESDHSSLMKELLARGIRAPVEKWGPANHYGADALVRLERQVVVLAEHYSGEGSYREFLQEQVDMTSAIRPADPRESPSGTSIAATLDGIRALFGLRRDDLPSSDRDVDRLMATMTPFLRSQLVFAALNAPEQVSGLFPLDRVPHVLGILHILALCARKSGMANVTFQTISRLYQQDTNILRLCAYFDTAVSTRKDSPVEFPALEDPSQRGSFVRILKALIHNRTSSSPVQLGAVLCEEVHGEIQERMHFLRQIATTLPKALTGLSNDEVIATGPFRSRVSAAMQRLTFALPDGVLLAAYDRRMGTTSSS